MSEPRASVTIVEQPSAVTQQEMRMAPFTVVATGVSPYTSAPTYQWQKMAPGAATWVDIEVFISMAANRPRRH